MSMVYPLTAQSTPNPVSQKFDLAGCLRLHVLSTQAVPLTAGTHEKQGRRTVVVMFIGGVTYAEISALRFLSTRPDLDCDFVIATTKLMNGTTMIEGLYDEPVKQLMAPLQPL